MAGRQVTGWFVEDFTLAEVKTLARWKRWPDSRASSARSDRVHEVITFDEVLLLAREESRNVGRDIGVYAELKWSSYFSSIGLPLEPAVLACLRTTASTDVTRQCTCFRSRPPTCAWLRDHCDVRLAQLVAISELSPRTASPWVTPRRTTAW